MNDDTMDSNVQELGEHVIGHKIVDVQSKSGITYITLDSGKVVSLTDSEDCCAYTEVESFLLNHKMVDHIITGVKSEDNYSTWHIFADMGDVLKLDVAWSEGTGYYGYGFYIKVDDE